jgi:hypothetical protein
LQQASELQHELVFTNMDLNFTEDEPLYTHTLFDFGSGVSDQSWTASHILTLCMCLPLITLGIAGNGLLIASWFVDERIRTPSNALLVSLAVPDKICSRTCRLVMVHRILVDFSSAYRLGRNWDSRAGCKYRSMGMRYKEDNSFCSSGFIQRFFKC